MNDSAVMIFVVIGVMSFLGSITAAVGAGYYLGKSHERQRIRGSYRLVHKAVWNVNETAMIVNLSQKRLIVLPGEKHPDSVSVVFADSTVVLKPSAVADASGILPEEPVT